MFNDCASDGVIFRALHNRSLLVDVILAWRRSEPDVIRDEFLDLLRKNPTRDEVAARCPVEETNSDSTPRATQMFLSICWRMAGRRSRTSSNQAETVGQGSPLGRVSTKFITGEAGAYGQNRHPMLTIVADASGYDGYADASATAISKVCIMDGSLTICGVKPAWAQSCVIASKKMGDSLRLNITKSSRASFSQRNLFSLRE